MGSAKIAESTLDRADEESKYLNCAETMVRMLFRFRSRGGKAVGQDHPIAWLHENEGGRFLNTELGHDVRSLDTKFGRQHLVEAIKWAGQVK